MESQAETAKTSRHSQPSAPVQEDFLFVDASEAKTSDRGRRAARSFVMRNARRKDPWSTSKQAVRQPTQESASPRGSGTPTSISTLSTASSSPTVESSRNGFPPALDQANAGVFKQGICSSCRIFAVRHRQTLCQRCILFRPMDLSREPNQGIVDPFRTSSVEMTMEVSKLLDHFLQEMAPGVIGVDIRCKSTLMMSDWYATAWRNTGFMYSLLCTTALHMFVSGKGNVETILRYRGETLSAVKKALPRIEDRTAPISDANLGAVFNLLTVEESLRIPHFKDEVLYEQPNAHLNGLWEMLRLRGGLGAISTNRTLQAFILWHSTAHAIAAFDSPNPATLEYIRTANYPCHPPGYYSRRSRHLVDLCQQAGLAASLIELLDSVLVLAADLSAWYDDPRSPLDALEIQNFSCALECLLLAWIREREPLVTPLESALCVALIIFTIRTTEALKQKSDIHHLHFVASKRLESALNCTTHADWRPCPDLLLWILSIGTISAEGSAQSAWFVNQTSLACAVFQIDSAEALLERLHLCGWVSYKLDESVHRLWSKIIHARLRSYPSALSPYIDNAESPPRPLQNGINESEFTDWHTADWAAIMAAMPTQESDFSNVGVSWTAATATGFGDAFGGALTDL